jgi:hypothetical protein
MKRALEYILRNYSKVIRILATIGGIIIMTQCIKFGCNGNGPYFHWMPAAKIEVKK